MKAIEGKNSFQFALLFVDLFMVLLLPNIPCWDLRPKRCYNPRGAVRTSSFLILYANIVKMRCHHCICAIPQL